MIRISFFYCFIPRTHDHMHCKATMRPVYHRTMWSLTIAYHGRRPQVGPDNLPDSVPAMYRKLKSAMMHRFACVQYKGDWEYHEKCWELQTYWRTKHICFLCHAAMHGRHGQSYTLFGSSFRRRSIADTIMNSFPAQPNPLVLVPGWHPQLIKFCAMHSLQLGVYQTVTAEALLWLCKHGVYGNNDLEIDVRLANAYVAFKSWLSRSRLTCSGRMFSSKRLHLSSVDYPFLGYKAYNTRVVLAFLAESCRQYRVNASTLTHGAHVIIRQRCVTMMFKPRCGRTWLLPMLCCTRSYAHVCAPDARNIIL